MHQVRSRVKKKQEKQTDASFTKCLGETMTARNQECWWYIFGNGTTCFSSAFQIPFIQPLLYSHAKLGLPGSIWIWKIGSLGKSCHPYLHGNQSRWTPALAAWGDLWETEVCQDMSSILECHKEKVTTIWNSTDQCQYPMPIIHPHLSVPNTPHYKKPSFLRWKQRKELEKLEIKWLGKDWNNPSTRKSRKWRVDFVGHYSFTIDCQSIIKCHCHHHHWSWLSW